MGLRLEGKRSARQGHIVKVGGKEAGIVNSACPSPTLGCPIAMAYVATGKHEVGSKVNVDLGKQSVDAEIVPLPFYKAK